MKEQQAMLRQRKTGSGCHTYRKNQGSSQKKRKLEKTA